MDEIAENDYNFNISRYIAPEIEEDTLTIENAMANLRKAALDAFAAEDDLIAVLKREGAERSRIS